MSFENKRIHYFHADATAIGGHIERPFVKDIPVQAPSALSPAGGAYEARTPAFDFEKILTAQETRTRVEGRFVRGLPTTRMIAEVRGLDVLGSVHVDEVVAYISTVHPGEEPDVPKVDFGMTTIAGLRIGDSILKVHLNLNLLNNGKGDRFPKNAPVYEKALWKKVGKKFRGQGFLQCSLVEKIEVLRGKRPDIIAPNIIAIPNIGRLHLAELLVDGYSYELIMMRFELGCPVVGSATMSAGKVNGGGSGP